MKKFAIVALALFIESEARRNGRGKEKKNKSDEEVEALYQSFQAEWNRSITSTGEYEKRIECFEKNKKIVEDNNAITAG